MHRRSSSPALEALLSGTFVFITGRLNTQRLPWTLTTSIL